jgi:hypothetical protein
MASVAPPFEIGELVSHVSNPNVSMLVLGFDKAEFSGRTEWSVSVEWVTDRGDLVNRTFYAERLVAQVFKKKRIDFNLAEKPDPS